MKLNTKKLLSDAKKSTKKGDIEKARKIYAIEKDARFLPALDDVRNAYLGRLEVINGDALNHTILENLNPPIQIFSNLPYNIGTELLTNWLDPPK